MPVNEKYGWAFPWIDEIAALASFEYQARYVLGGTKDEFVSIDDLVWDFLGEDTWIEKNLLDSEIKSEILKFHQFLEDNVDKALDASNFAEVGPLMRESAIWDEIRARATAVLRIMNISLEEIPVEEIDDHDWGEEVYDKLGIIVQKICF